MKTIEVEQLHKDLQSDKHKHILIDVRSEAEHKQNRIPGAKNIPIEKLDEFLEDLNQYEAVYVHCQSGNRSKKACEQLQNSGLKNIINVDGGINEWEEANFETIRKKGSIPIMRQVFITAGLLILTGYTLSVLIHPNWIFLSVFVGLGLLFAGSTGICFMTKVLAKMPWNK